jgi:hypothetical protein
MLPHPRPSSTCATLRRPPRPSAPLTTEYHKPTANTSQAIATRQHTDDAQRALTFKPTPHLSPISPSTSWLEYIYTESRRRLGVLCRIVNLLVYLEPTSKCTLPSDLVLAPLPGPKKLWEAKSVEEWKVESERDMGWKTVFGLNVRGDLVRLDEGQVYWVDAVMPVEDLGRRREAMWEEWCVGIDALGGLVLLAASLLGQA